MLIYLVTRENLFDGYPSTIVSWHPSATDALKVAKEKAVGGMTDVHRVKVRMRNKKDLCKLMQGRMLYDTWDTVFTCSYEDGKVRVRRLMLG